MTLLDLPSSYDRTPPAMVWTAGVSGDARFIDSTARESIQGLSRAYSLDDGRMRVQEALVEQFEECSQRGWDGYGAEPVRDDTYRNAYRFIEALPHGFPMPTVGAEADGHLTLEWYRNPSRVVSVSVSPEGDLHYAALLGGTARRNGTEPFLGDVPADLLQIIRRVLFA
jgi:hypothetical protein